jgi:hypothetical protein
MAWIKFKDKQSENTALFKLFIQHTISCKSYIGGIHNIPDDSLKLLDKNSIKYEEIKNKEEIIKALETARRMSLGQSVED